MDGITDGDGLQQSGWLAGTKLLRVYNSTMRTLPQRNPALFPVTMKIFPKEAQNMRHRPQGLQQRCVVATLVEQLAE